MTTSPQATYRSLGVEYTGFLNAKLRDLRGIATLANELIQNADDDPDATEIVFDLLDDAMVVRNDGTFTDCGNMELEECPWTLERGHRCDFHRFRRTASGDKRNEDNTTGAFGIGFIAVYQVTNTPELTSNSRHWVIDPTRPEDKRILESSATGSEGTAFRLPWATDASDLRRKQLGVEPVPLDAADQFTAELVASLPASSLFLRKLQRIALHRNGLPVLTIGREMQQDRLTMVETDHRTGVRTVGEWRIVSGNFERDANAVRSLPGANVEPKRKAQVVVAIPRHTATFLGHFYASLPTEHATKLPLHINADFFTSSDRKRVVFGSDYQGQWNRAAVRAAAHSFALALPELTSFLDPRAIWQVLAAMHDLVGDASHSDTSSGTALAQFWQTAGPQIRNYHLVYTSQKQWWTPPQVVLLQSEKIETPALPLLDLLGFKVVHPDLNYYLSLLTDSEVGVPVLTSDRLAIALVDAGLGAPIPLTETPDWYQDDSSRALLSREIAILTSRPGNHSRLEGCALVLALDGFVRSPLDLRKADEVTQQVFAALDALYYLAGDNPEGISSLVSDFTVTDAVGLLESTPEAVRRDLWLSHPDQWLDLLAWFAARSAELMRVPQSQGRLARLAIWPAADSLHPLDDLAIPGDFRDPLGLARLVDPRLIERSGDFLRQLGVRTLNLETYLIVDVRQFLTQNTEISAGQYMLLMDTLIDNFGKIRDNGQVRTVLASLKVVYCTDKYRRKPTDTYFPSDIVRAVLGANVPVPQFSDQIRTDGYRDLLYWLGVAEQPRPSDILQRIGSLTAHPPTSKSVRTIQAIFKFLGDHWDKGSFSLASLYDSLRSKTWLPARALSDRWFAPQELFTDFQSYLFFSQAHFLDIPRTVQNDSAAFLSFLNVRTVPSVAQVVDHILEATKGGFELNREVYTFLELRADDPAIGRLHNEDCLLLAGIGFVRPRKTFWGEHFFGTYRHTLTSDFRSFVKLLSRLGVKESPSVDDALTVLSEVARYTPSSGMLDENAYKVVIYCWRLLASALDKEPANESLRASICELVSSRVIPDHHFLLRKPSDLLFADRPRLADKVGAVLANEIIPRPQDIWHAMELAGVRPLSKAIDVQLVECIDPRSNDSLHQLLSDRRHLVVRVMEAVPDHKWDRDLLREIQFESTVALQIKYQIVGFGGYLPSHVEDTLAFFGSDTKTIMYNGAAEMPWSAIARELAYAICPNGDAGLIAPGLREVLQATDELCAARELDEMGFAPLQATESLALAQGHIASLGGAPSPDESALNMPEDTVTTGESQPFAETSSSDSVLSDDLPTHPLPGQLVATNSDVASTSVTEPPQASSHHTPPTVTDERTGTPAESSHQKPHAELAQIRLRSYVTHGSSLASIGMDHDSSRVDAAAMEHAMKYELRNGRRPHSMAHNHPGYDIESYGAEGQLLRYIEVKGLSDTWGARGAGMTETQFRRAVVEAEQYWLYVVERSDQTDARIYRIQNPANRVNQFLFDDGWRDAAETQSVTSLEDEWPSP